MSLFAGLDDIVRQNEPLAGHTWFGIGGPAQYFISPRNVDQLAAVVKRCRENSVPMYVMGSGANLLIDDAGIDGAVIRLTEGSFKEIQLIDGGIRVGAGVEMGKLVLRCVRDGLSGLECLTGIPGSVGGCVRMNAGGAFGDIGNCVKSVQVMTESGEQFTRYHDDLAFAYRSTNITSKFILSAEFSLEEEDPHQILKQVKQIWIYKKNTQPLGSRNAGCIFKNPRGISAGALIDRAGLKGKQVGGASVSEKHANFILAEAGTKASDVLKLINIIRDAVYEKNGVYLELEVEVW
ncbi:MAG: UDP-N-acetylmuramate dehydrogenase [Phycisphaerae bacterium]